MDDKNDELNDDLYAVQLDKENCHCNTYKAFERAKMHIIQLDTDSLILAIASDSNKDFTQGFDAIIKDPEFINENKGFIFSDNGQRKILGIDIEKQGSNCIALSPKNYIINDEIVLKGIILDQIPQIKEQTFVDYINKGRIATAINTLLAQSKCMMSRIQIEHNAITGSDTKVVILPNRSCLSFISKVLEKLIQYLVQI
ncbi:MAG: hypothetical protein EZS28_014817 [Streblomastix strix]|uniref:Uncharacterized protein n=1 Tax=Streblomastix strix TaxID=222440 RepID=A0A5J4W494_9EUKA|nr:MAG: hypothetical protein EZS28_014817 [Streblomastix strix]